MYIDVASSIWLIKVEKLRHDTWSCLNQYVTKKAFLPLPQDVWLEAKRLEAAKYNFSNEAVLPQEDWLEALELKLLQQRNFI